MIETAIIMLAAGSCVAWLFLLFCRGGFWRADQRLSDPTPQLDRWPAVVAVIPARDEAATIGRTVASLLAQDYPGRLNVVVVDDGSGDGTATVARAAGAGSDRVAVIDGEPLSPGWTGKLWAVHQGLRHAAERWPESEYHLLTDADIEHDPDNLRRLVAKGKTDGCDLVSLMVQLHCGSFWERLLIPAFVFFFQKLFPFLWVNDPRRPEAAAAGGCVLVRRRTLDEAGGIAAIRGNLIDDCTLAAMIKRHGAIWLGLATKTRSLRRYDELSELWLMVARTAFTQLNHSPGALLVTVLGMVVIYGVPPMATAYGVAGMSVAAAGLGALAWLMMAVAFRPTLQLYRMPAWWGMLLPAAGFLYTLMTVDSARRHWLGRGGLWKGRSQGTVGETGVRSG
jgi:hopene-associated glycosyltransferase HpnB